MTNKTKLVWRLSKLPTPDEVRELVKDKIITQDEAREILFSSESYAVDPKGKETKLIKQDDLESEIKFLRQLVENLAANRSQIVDVIRHVTTPSYTQYPWYQPYWTWCSVNDSTITNVGYSSSGIASSDVLGSGTNSGQLMVATTTTPFSLIQTF